MGSGDRQSERVVTFTCPECRGTGYKYNQEHRDNCVACEGTGRVSANQGYGFPPSMGKK